METRVLKYFLEVAKEGNITHAAEHLHISQPTISKRIKDLEEELGVKLFTRTNYAIKLTEATSALMNIIWRKNQTFSPAAKVLMDEMTLVYSKKI